MRAKDATFGWRFLCAWILIAVAARLTTAQHCAGFGRLAAKSATIAALINLPAIA